MWGYLIPLISVCLATGCQRQEQNAVSSDLNSIKKNFLLSILDSSVEESPFHMNYSLKTVFFSTDIVSLFGEIHVYDHLPHGWWRYEGKTFCRIQGKLKEVSLGDLFSTVDQKEFLRKYCENSLKSDSISYFSGEDPLRSRLEHKDIHTFVINDKFLIIFFQPYTVCGLGEEPPQVKIPYEHLKDKWNTSQPLTRLIDKIISSKSYTASWDQESYIPDL